ncbi:hypothetical protein TWF694_000375 [Orbilia ellipsospora]|uniref:Uncharacterized protein n=1 Tax=Orbilia ellipsospora TaxID=2528407 RepID=A0AAV9XNE7_9PEZI
MEHRSEDDIYSPSVYSQPSRVGTVRTVYSQPSRTGTERTMSAYSIDTVSSLDTIIPTRTSTHPQEADEDEYDLANEKAAYKIQESARNSQMTMQTPLLEQAAPMAEGFAPLHPVTSFAPYQRTETQGSRRKTADVPDFGLPLPRFIIRGILSITVPLALIVYYFLTYWRWLRFPQGSPETWRRTGYLDNVNLVNYSWFVIATFALNLGTYATAGSVAAMVMRKRWAPKNFRRLLILAENTFQDPAGWLSAIIKLIRKRKFYKRNGAIWDILAFFSIIGFAAWPLTGLTMQTTDGFSISRKLKEGTTLVVGRNFTSINARDGALATSRATDFWSSGFSAEMPSRRQFYITPGSSIQLNVSQPNDLPDDASESIFLGPQATGPIIGEVFGLAIRYNCTIINSASQFIILNRRNRTLDLPPPFDARNGPTSGYQLPGIDKAVILLRNKTSNTGFISNVNASLELGSNIGAYNITDPSDSESIGYASIFTDYPGINRVVTLEAALWQSIEPISSYDLIGVNRDNFNFEDVRDDIPELRDQPLYPGQKAVGVQCQASSAIGTAIVNGVTGEYTNFTQVNANPRNGGGIKRFETGIPHMILQTPVIPIGFQLSQTGDQWFTSLYSAIEKSSLTTNAFGDFLDAQPSVLQAEDLREALLRAHKTWAVQIMYDGLTEPTYQWKLANVTLGYQAMTLTRGVVPPEIVLAMLTVWALSMVVLAAAYQFRRRWTETLDGYTIFRFGVDRPEDLVPELLAGEFDNAAILEKVPGMVGDLERDKEVGYIGLVRERVEARWDKRYG